MEMNIDYILRKEQALFGGLAGAATMQKTQALATRGSIRGSLAKYKLKVSAKRLLGKTLGKIGR